MLTMLEVGVNMDLNKKGVSVMKAKKMSHVGDHEWYCLIARCQ
jgi:hypothetical protein